jgi:hypothetical protein
MRALLPLAAVLTPILAIGCDGVISDPAGTTDPGGRPNLDTDGDGVPDVLFPAPGTMRRLSAAQYVTTVKDLFGEPIEVPSELEPDTAVNGFVSVGSSRTTISPRGVEQYETAAFGVAGQVIADVPLRESVVPCAPTGAADAACLRQTVSEIGRRAWRRPLSTAEVDRYASVAVDAATTLGDFWAGVEFAIAGLLQSPSFLFRIELGEPDPSDPTRLRYTSWEMASRLSYFMWNSTPDDELLDAAERGELTDPAGLREQAERLSASPRARESVRTFFTEALDLVAMDELSKDASIYPSYTATMGRSMLDGALYTVDHLVFEEEADYRSFFDTRLTYVNSELAALYGVEAPAGDGFGAVMLPTDGPRAGLLGQAAVLARNSHPTATSPTLRGKFVRQVLLCQEIPAPPADVGELPEPSPTARTMRERLEIHRQNEACAGCHAMMDPIGLGLENFDGVGAFRTTENDVTIDPSGDLDGTYFADAAELGTALRDHPNLGQCLVRNLYRFATGHIETRGEEVAILDLVSAFEDDYRIRGLLVDLVSSDGFRYASEPR